MTPRLAQLSRSTRRLAAFGAALVLATFLGVGVTGWELRSNALHDARQETRNLGVVIAEQTARSFQAVDLVLEETRAEILARGVATPEAFRDALASRAVHDTLLARLKNLPQADAILLVGADGRMVNSSRAWPVGPIDLRDRDYYRAETDHPDAGVFIGAPVVGRAAGTRIICLTRRIEGPGGVLLGLVLGAIRVTYFEDLFRAIELTGGGAVTILRRDGTVLVHQSNRPQAAGARVRDGSPWHAIVRQGAGHYRAPDGPGGTARLVSVHPLADYPVVVDVSLSESGALAHWRREMTLIALGALLALNGILFLLRALAAQLDRLQSSRRSLTRRNAEIEAARERLQEQADALERAGAALRRSEARLAEKSALLETTLEHMDQGLMMVDAAGIVAVCNRRVVELLDLPPALMAARPAFTSVLEHQWSTDEFSATDEATKARIRSGGLLAMPHTYERRRPDGTTIEIRSVPLAGGGIVRTYTDITQRKAAEDRVRHFAEHDELTQLANRAVFRDRLAEAVERAGRGEHGLAVLYLDLDRFKLINDTRGHEVGDRLLAEVARRMRASVREGDTLARMGGDEFAIIQPAPLQPDDAAALARRLVDAVALPFEIDGALLSIGLSVGIAWFAGDGMSPDQLLRNADAALYRAKQGGRGTWRLFTPGMEAELQGGIPLAGFPGGRFPMERELRQAVAVDGLQLAFQPILDAGAGTVRGFEALLRWRHPVHGPIPPAEFIPAAEESGLILALGGWVLEHACAEAAGWEHPVRLAVNASPLQFRQPGFSEQVAAALRRAGLAPGRLELEVTEGVLLDDSPQVLGTMRALRAQGVRMALDDFGTAHAGLSYLRRFPFETIKIDQSFVRSLPDDEEARAIVEAILSMGRGLRLAVVAEGVETPAQLEWLRALGCDQVQGILTGEPMPAEQARGFLRRHGCGHAQAVGPRRAAMPA